MPYRFPKPASVQEINMNTQLMHEYKKSVCNRRAKQMDGIVFVLSVVV